ncbi:MAG: TrmH family RNA methyltransferase [Acidimicrobiia bacterium]
MIDGPTLVAEAVAAGVEIQSVYVEFDARHLIPGGLPDTATVFEVEPGVLAKVSSTMSPQPIMAVATIEVRPLPIDSSFVVVCDKIGDPGNAGTILRSAEAAGADAVVFTPGSVDVWNPKCVRASAGALFWVPVLTDVDPRGLGLPLVGAVAHGGVNHTAFDFTAPCAVVLGNEAHGIDPALALDALVTVAHAGRAESLNVAMAATVLCFEIARQRSLG